MTKKANTHIGSYEEQQQQQHRCLQWLQISVYKCKITPSSNVTTLPGISIAKNSYKLSLLIRLSIVLKFIRCKCYFHDIYSKQGPSPSPLAKLIYCDQLFHLLYQVLPYLIYYNTLFHPLIKTTFQWQKQFL